MGASHPVKHSWAVGTIEIMSLILSKWWFYVSKIQGLLSLLAGNSHCIKLHPPHMEGVKGTLRMIKWQWSRKGTESLAPFTREETEAQTDQHLRQYPAPL